MVKPPNRARSVHDQGKFMEEKLFYDFPSSDDREVILEDFKILRVIDSIRKTGPNRENISHYDYFIIRPAARRKIPLKELTEEEVENHRYGSRETNMEKSTKKPGKCLGSPGLRTLEVN